MQKLRDGRTLRTRYPKMTMPIRLMAKATMDEEIAGGGDEAGDAAAAAVVQHGRQLPLAIVGNLRLLSLRRGRLSVEDDGGIDGEVWDPLADADAWASGAR